jgi:hypothetical protein
LPELVAIFSCWLISFVVWEDSGEWSLAFEFENSCESPITCFTWPNVDDFWLSKSKVTIQNKLITWI